MRASAVAEAPDAVETPLEKTGPAFEPLKSSLQKDQAHLPFITLAAPPAQHPETPIGCA